MNKNSKNEEKQQKILDASIKLFSHKGYAGTKTSEISKEAKIGIGTLFNYYPSKQILVNETFLYCCKEFVDYLKTLAPQKDFKTFIKEIFFKTIDYAVNNKSLFIFIALFSNSPEISLEIKKESDSYIFNFIKEFFEIKNNISKEQYIYLFSMMIFENTIAVLKLIEKNPNYPIDEIKEVSFNLLWQGLNIIDENYKISND